MSNKRSFVLVLMILVSTAVGAQAQNLAPTASPSPSPSPTPTPTLESQFFKNIWKDQKTIWTSPFRLEKSDAKWMVPLGIGTMALFTTDRMTGDEINEADRQLTVSKAISYAGSAYALGATAGAFYFIGRGTHNYRARETGILSAQALINASIVGGALKLISQRGRPDDGSERSEFFDGGSSFPSGHAISTWAVATVVANEYHDKKSVQIAAYGIATAVSIARVTGKNHYISDSFIGSLAGFAIGRYVYRAHHREDSALDDQTTTVTKWPTITPAYDRRDHQYGVGLHWNF